MENPCFVHQLKGDSNNNELPVYDGLHFKISAGCAILLQHIFTGTHKAYAVNGTTFRDGSTEIQLYSGGVNNKLEAPISADVEVIIDGKYDIADIRPSDFVDQFGIALTILDEIFLNYYGANQENDFYFDVYGIDMNNYGFGHIEHLNRIGNLAHRCKIKNFDWESEENGLSSENMPNLKTFSVTPTVDVPITAYGRLTSIETISFVQEHPYHTYGKIEDLCAALIANGKTNNFTILTNQVMTLNGERLGYNKTVNCVYTNGQFVCTIAS